MIGQNIMRQEIQIEIKRKAESERPHVAAEEVRCQNITGKPWPRGDTQIIKKWVNL